MSITYMGKNPSDHWRTDELTVRASGRVAPSAVMPTTASERYKRSSGAGRDTHDRSDRTGTATSPPPGGSERAQVVWIGREWLGSSPVGPTPEHRQSSAPAGDSDRSGALTRTPSVFATSAIRGWNTHAVSPMIGIIDAPTMA